MAVTKLRGVTGFEWDDANIEHIAKHHVVPEEAEQVFFDENNVLDEDIKHSTRDINTGEVKLYEKETSRS